MEVLMQIIPSCAWISTPKDTRRQKERTQELWHDTQAAVLRETDPETAVSIIDNSSTLGSRWLRCLPLNPRLTINNEEFAAGLAARLLLPPQVCRNCKSPSPGPLHHNGCNLPSSMKIQRHEAVKHRLAESLEACGAAVTIEPAAISSNRRADITVEHAVVGGRIALDVTIAGLSPSQAFSEADSTPLFEGTTDNDPPRRSLAHQYIRRCLDARYRRKQQEARNVFFGATFQPFVLSAGGTLHPEALRYIRRVRDADFRLADQWYYEVSAALLKARALAYMRTYVHSGTPSPPTLRT